MKNSFRMLKCQSFPLDWLFKNYILHVGNKCRWVPYLKSISRPSLPRVLLEMSMFPGFGSSLAICRVQVSSVISLIEAFYAMEFGCFHLFNVTFQKNAVCYYFLSGFRCVVLLNRALEVSTHLCKGGFNSLCSGKQDNYRLVNIPYFNTFLWVFLWYSVLKIWLVHVFMDKQVAFEIYSVSENCLWPG